MTARCWVALSLTCVCAEWRFEIQVIQYADGFVSSSVVAGAPVVDIVDTEVLSLIDPGQYD